MKRHQTIFLAALSLTLSACSSMNSNFSCNATAGDNCLSLDEVNAMTEKNSMRAAPMDEERVTSSKARERRVYIAPWKDSKGVKHKGALVYVPELSKGASV